MPRHGGPVGSSGDFWWSCCYIEVSPDFCIDATEVPKSLIFGGFHDRSRRALVAGSDASVEISLRKDGKKHDSSDVSCSQWLSIIQCLHISSWYFTLIFHPDISSWFHPDFISSWYFIIISSWFHCICIHFPLFKMIHMIPPVSGSAITVPPFCQAQTRRRQGHCSFGDLRIFFGRIWGQKTRRFEYDIFTKIWIPRLE